MFQKSKRLLLSIIFFSTLTGGVVHAQASSYEALQAAYIFNFAKYVTWPNSSPTFIIGVYGDLDVMKVLEKAFSGRKIGGKRTEVKIIITDQEIPDCHIIYVPESGTKNFRELTIHTEGKNILIVTEDDLIKKGAAISFVVEDERLKFKLKAAALAKAGLSASEGLLKLAIVQ